MATTPPPKIIRPAVSNLAISDDAAATAASDAPGASAAGAGAAGAADEDGVAATSGGAIGAVAPGSSVVGGSGGRTGSAMSRDPPSPRPIDLGAWSSVTADARLPREPRRWEDAAMHDGTVGLVLAAGSGSRFGGGKLLASVAGRPVLQHVLDALAEAGVDDVVVVLGDDAAAHEAAIAWRAERRVVNPEPRRGLASSLQVGFEAVGAGHDSVLVALGDQPLISPSAIRSLLDAPGETRPAVRRAGLCRATTAATRSSCARPGSGWSPMPRAIAVWARSSPPTRSSWPRSRSRATNPDVDTRGRPGHRHRGVVGGPRPGQPRAGRADPRGPRRDRLLRSRPVALPGRPDPARRPGPGRPVAARSVRRDVARRRGRGRTLRAADRAGARPVRRLGRRARRVAVDARRRCSRSPRTTPSRTSGRSTGAGRRPTTGRWRCTRPTSR